MDESIGFAPKKTMAYIGKVARAGRRYCLSGFVTSGDSPSLSRPETISSAYNNALQHDDIIIMLMMMMQINMMMKMT